MIIKELRRWYADYDCIMAENGKKEQEQLAPNMKSDF